MRTIILVAVTCVAISSTGCVSAMIAGAGRDPSSYQHRAEV